MNSSFPLASITHSSQIDVCKRVNLLQMNLLFVHNPPVSDSQSGAYLGEGGGGGSIVPFPFLSLPFSKKEQK